MAMDNKTDTVVKLILVFFVSLLSFSVGTLVGKRFSDNQYKMSQYESGKKTEAPIEEVADMGDAAADMASSEPTAEAGHATAHEGEAKPMSDEEVARLAQEFVSGVPAKHDAAEEKKDVAPHGEKAEATHETTKAEPTPAKKQPKVTAAAKEETHAETAHVATTEKAPEKTAEKAPEKVAATEKTEKEAKRVPSSVPKDVYAAVNGKYTVQVGSYADEKEAEKIAVDLKAKGFSAFYSPADVKGTTWYRVNVGLFSNKNDAKKQQDTLKEKAQVAASFIQILTK